MRWTRLTLALSLYCLGSAACSGSEREATSQATSDHAGHAPSGAADNPLNVTAPKGAKVFFVGLEDGATLTGPLSDGKVNVKINMGASGIEVRAAGEQVPGTGHHHIIIDGAPIPAGGVVPKDEKHLHFGQGQTEAELALAPGEYTLTLQFADGAHLSYGPELAASIKVKVAEETSAAAP